MTSAPITAACITYDPSLMTPAALVKLVAEELESRGMASSASDLDIQPPANHPEAVERCSRYVRLQTAGPIPAKSIKRLRRSIMQSNTPRAWSHIELAPEPGVGQVYILWRDENHERLGLAGCPLEQPLLPAGFKMLPATEQATTKSAIASGCDAMSDAKGRR